MRISDWSSDVCSSDLIRPLVRLNVSIVVEENGRRESGYFGLGGRYMYDHLFEEAQWNRAIDEALNQALVNLRAVDAPAGEMTVLLGPGWPGVLPHEAVRSEERRGGNECVRTCRYGWSRDT